MKDNANPHMCANLACHNSVPVGGGHCPECAGPHMLRELVKDGCTLYAGRHIHQGEVDLYVITDDNHHHVPDLDHAIALIGKLNEGTEEDGASSGQEASEDPRPQPGSRGAYLISETMNEMACRMWDAYTDPESNGIDQDDASQLALQVSAAYQEERQGASEDPAAGQAEEPPQTPGPRYIAHFCKPGTRYGDCEGADNCHGEWDCTRFVSNYAKASEISVEAALELLVTDTGQRALRLDPAAPAWVRDWSGPFTITVRRKEGKQT